MINAFAASQRKQHESADSRQYFLSATQQICQTDIKIGPSTGRRLETGSHDRNLPLHGGKGHPVFSRVSDRKSTRARKNFMRASEYQNQRRFEINCRAAMNTETPIASACLTVGGVISFALCAGLDRFF
jgi:hypothetical protein